MSKSNTDKSSSNSNESHQAPNSKLRKVVSSLHLWLYMKMLKSTSKSLLKTYANNRNILVNILLDDFLSTYGNNEADFRVLLAISVAGRLLPKDSLSHRDLPKNLHEKLNEIRAFETENELFINYEISRFANDAHIRRVRADHFRLRSYERKLFLDNRKAEEYLAKAQEINPQVAPLSHRSFSRLSRRLKKERKRRLKAYRIRTRERAEEKRSASMTALGFSFHDAKALLGVASVLFLCGGYIYNRLVLGYFGVDVSKFFQITDYLSASLDKISTTGLTVVVSIVLGLWYWSPGYLAARRKMSKKRLLFDDFPFYIIAVMVPVALVLSFYFDRPDKYSILLLFLVIVCSKQVFRLSQHFKNRLLWYLIITYVFMFFALIFTQAFHDREYISKHAEPTAIKYHTSLPVETQTSNVDLYLITSNSSYYFFFSRKFEKTYVVPKQSISFIEIGHVPQKGLFGRLHNLMHPGSK